MPERHYTAIVRTVASELSSAAAGLAQAGSDSPRLDAELLLGRVVGLDRAGLVLQPRRELSYAEVGCFWDLLERRRAREPVAYILGCKGFRSIELEVDARVLIPRPETELLVEAALSLPVGARVVDVGTGSGAVALALAHERPDLRLRGLDVSADAVAVARGNGARLGLGVDFAVADLLDGDAYDVVLANLPYVTDAEREALAPEITRYEPELALLGGPDGLALIRRLVAGLGEGVHFAALEIGPGQAAAVEALLGGAGFGSLERRPDLAGHERVVVGRR
ncbi:MAG: peptide chain release factor N(5)-glutamine methyltransferase [Actinomycetota bacterium]|nr:peptide chain release factor N(5)-glutamine methyltransferase [Actinomycetota bacterium]